MAGIALTGCYGSTEPATDLRSNGATLNAKGTTQESSARSWFEYWPTSTPSAKVQTAEKNWPAGVSGPVAQQVRRLRRQTQYSFRFCGSDITDEGYGPTACAQTRTFTTPNGDSADAVYGELRFGGERPTGYFVDASSGPQGQSPKGEVYSIGLDTNFRGQVTCLLVSGNRATVGALGQLKTDPPDGNPDGPGSVVITIEAPNAAGQNTAINPVQRRGSTAPSCAGASFANQQQFPIMQGFQVQDAP